LIDDVQACYGDGYLIFKQRIAKIFKGAFLQSR
jgi:hypothetical protein